MASDPIQDLLRQADALAGPAPNGPDDLAGRARRILRRRRIVRGVSASAAAAAVLIVAACITLLRPPSSQEPQIVAEPPVETPSGPTAEALAAKRERLRAELAALNDEIRVRQATVDRLVVQEQRLQRRRELAALVVEIPDPTADIRRQVERAAYTTIRMADRLERDSGPAAAAAVYRQVIDNFPRTSWAQVARKRLSRITNQMGET